ncbi:MAG: ABC transporter permease [Alphaproteobacteria bacterium]|nr:ABC transporter permease [Alphaproteobacteria bacterium]
MTRRRSVQLALMLAPAVALIGLLFLYPLFGILKLSLFNPAFTLESFDKLRSSPVAALVMQRTFLLALTVAVLCFVLGYPIAYFLATMRPRWRAFFLYLILLPFWISVLIRTYTWMVLLGREGLVNGALHGLGITDGPVQMLFTGFAVHLAMVQILMPIMILTCFAAMVEIDPQLVKAARTLGASPWKAFATVFFPMSLGGAAAGAIICFILGLGFYVTPALLGGRRNIMLANLIDFEVHQTLNWSFASVLALVLLAATLVLLGLFRLVAPERRLHG